MLNRWRLERRSKSRRRRHSQMKISSPFSILFNPHSCLDWYIRQRGSIIFLCWKPSSFNHPIQKNIGISSKDDSFKKGRPVVVDDSHQDSDSLQMVHHHHQWACSILTCSIGEWKWFADAIVVVVVIRSSSSPPPPMKESRLCHGWCCCLEGYYHLHPILLCSKGFLLVINPWQILPFCYVASLKRWQTKIALLPREDRGSK